MLNGAQFEQLPMFMSAREIHDHIPPGDLINAGDTPEDLYARKLRQAKTYRYNDDGGKTLHESIAVEGVKEPVTIWSHHGFLRLGEGHHRVAVGMGTDPDRLLPVTHDSRAAEKYRMRSMD